MTKYGRGLNKEIYLAVKKGEIKEPFCIKDVKEFIKIRGWNIPESYINVCLVNATAETHSLTYKKYFKSAGKGKYTLSSETILNYK